MIYINASPESSLRRDRRLEAERSAMASAAGRLAGHANSGKDNHVTLVVGVTGGSSCPALRRQWNPSLAPVPAKLSKTICALAWF